MTIVCPGPGDLINTGGGTCGSRSRAAQAPPNASKELSGKSLRGHTEVDPKDYDLVVLAMQEAQYGSTACAS